MNRNAAKKAISDTRDITKKHVAKTYKSVAKTIKTAKVNTNNFFTSISRGVVYN